MGGSSFLPLKHHCQSTERNVLFTFVSKVKRWRFPILVIKRWTQEVRTMFPDPHWYWTDPPGCRETASIERVSVSDLDVQFSSFIWQYRPLKLRTHSQTNELTFTTSRVVQTRLRRTLDDLRLTAGTREPGRTLAGLGTQIIDTHSTILT